MKIWALFSVDNLYDQPRNNLVTWWSRKPTFEEVQRAISTPPYYVIDAVEVESILRGNTVRYDDTDYRLEEINEGEVL